MVDDEPPAGEATNREAAAPVRESVGELREDTACVPAPEQPRAEEHVEEAPAMSNDTDVSGTAEGPAAPAGGEGAAGDGGGRGAPAVDEAGKSPGHTTGTLGAFVKGHAMGVTHTCDTSSGAGRGDLHVSFVGTSVWFWGRRSLARVTADELDDEPLNMLNFIKNVTAEWPAEMAQELQRTPKNLVKIRDRLGLRDLCCACEPQRPSKTE